MGHHQHIIDPRVAQILAHFIRQHSTPPGHADEGEAEYDEDEDEEEITLSQYLVELVWKDKRTRYQLWNCGKVIVLFGVTVWAMRRFPHFQDPERLDQKVVEYMDHQQR